MVNLVKGQRVSLVKDNGSQLSQIMIGLGWDPVEQKRGLFGLGKKAAEIDCDASVLLLGENGKLVKGAIDDQCVYFGNLMHKSHAISHHGDNLTGGGDGDDEEIDVILPMVPAEVKTLVFVVNIYDANVRGQHFGMIRNAFIRVVDKGNGQELLRYSLSDDYTGYTGLLVAQVTRTPRGWEFAALGDGVKDASRLGSLLNLYR